MTSFEARNAAGNSVKQLPSDRGAELDIPKSRNQHVFAVKQLDKLMPGVINTSVVNVNLVRRAFSSLRDLSHVRSLRFALPLGICMVASQAGCAIKYQDSSGRLRVVGLAAMTITPATDNPQEVKRLELKNVGVMVYATAASSGVSAGYNREEIVFADRNTPTAAQTVAGQ